MAADERTRPRRPDELADHVVGRLRVLDRGITDLDRGDEHGLDDIVAAARALASGGRGDRMLFEFAREVGEAPAVHPVTVPVPDDSAITFATGALPVPDGGAGAASPRSLQALMGMRCLVVVASDGAQQRKYTWDELVRHVAAKLGAVHSDSDVPVAFDEISRFEMAGQGALGYALRNLGVVVSRHAHSLLATAGLDTERSPVSHRIPAAGTAWTGAVLVRDGRAVTVEFSPVVTSLGRGTNHATGVPLFSIPTHMQSGASSTTGPVGRNDPCPCGSGTKHKRCCGW